MLAVGLSPDRRCSRMANVLAEEGRGEATPVVPQGPNQEIHWDIWHLRDDNREQASTKKLPAESVTDGVVLLRDSLYHMSWP